TPRTQGPPLWACHRHSKRQASNSPLSGSTAMNGTESRPFGQRHGSGLVWLGVRRHGLRERADLCPTSKDGVAHMLSCWLRPSGPPHLSSNASGGPITHNRTLISTKKKNHHTRRVGTRA